MKAGSKLEVEFLPDGSIKVNGTGLIGTDAELLKDLQALAKELGGELVVEKHVQKHTHSQTHSHHLTNKQ